MKCCEIGLDYKAAHALWGARAHPLANLEESGRHMGGPGSGRAERCSPPGALRPRSTRRYAPLPLRKDDWGAGRGRGQGLSLSLHMFKFCLCP